MRVPPSKTHPNGYTTTRSAHCALNPSGKDHLIAGWTQYWNEVFNPKQPLDPNLVKALIASESSFNPSALANKKNSNSARGLTQLTNETRKLLGSDSKELKDHFIDVTKKELLDPSINICAGVRWLFRKKEIATGKLKREATWDEAVYEFKGLDKADQKRREELWNRFKTYLQEYQRCGKK